MPTAHFAHVKL